MLDYTAQNFMQWSRLGSRKLFGLALKELAKDDSNLFVIAADVASSAGLNEFCEELPEQFFNTGISEQNMIAMASGMALEGKNVFVTSFAPFASLRPFEAIKSLVGSMHLNVKIVSLASGFSLGVQGNSHFALDDIAVMRTIPGMTILSPSDCVETVKCLDVLSKFEGPAYLRLTGLAGAPNIHKEDYDFSIGKIEKIKDGENVAILATGAVINECVRATRLLGKDGISCSVYNVHTLKPLDEEFIGNLAKQHKMIVTVEEHGIVGGLGSSVSEIVSSLGASCVVKRMGAADAHLIDGDYSFLLDHCGLSSAKIRENILNDYSRL